MATSVTDLVTLQTRGDLHRVLIDRNGTFFTSEGALARFLIGSKGVHAKLLKSAAMAVPSPWGVSPRVDVLFPEETSENRCLVTVQGTIEHAEAVCKAVCTVLKQAGPLKLVSKPTFNFVDVVRCPDGSVDLVPDVTGFGFKNELSEGRFIAEWLKGKHDHLLNQMIKMINSSVKLGVFTRPNGSTVLNVEGADARQINKLTNFISSCHWHHRVWSPTTSEIVKSNKSSGELVYRTSHVYVIKLDDLMYRVYVDMRGFGVSNSQTKLCYEWLMAERGGVIHRLTNRVLLWRHMALGARLIRETTGPCFVRVFGGPGQVKRFADLLTEELYRGKRWDSMLLLNQDDIPREFDRYIENKQLSHKECHQDTIEEAPKNYSTEQHNDWTKQNNDWTEQHDDWTEQHNDWTKQNNDWTEQHNDWTEQHNDWTKQHEDLTEQHNDWTEQHNDWTEQHNDWTEHSKDLRDKTGDLSDRKNNRNEQENYWARERHDWDECNHDGLDQTSGLYNHLNDVKQGESSCMNRSPVEVKSDLFSVHDGRGQHRRSSTNVPTLLSEDLKGSVRSVSISNHHENVDISDYPVRTSALPALKVDKSGQVDLFPVSAGGPFTATVLSFDVQLSIDCPQSYLRQTDMVKLTQSVSKSLRTCRPRLTVHRVWSQGLSLLMHVSLKNVDELAELQEYLKTLLFC
jgi:hypothetical protein